MHIGPWLLFHGPVILLYIAKTISFMKIIVWENILNLLDV